MMRRNFLRIFPLALALFIAASTTHAENSLVQTAVNRFMRTYTDKLMAQFGTGTRVEYTVSSLDSQLNVGACPTGLTAAAKDAGQLSARLSVQVSCTNNWSIYVPIDLAIYRQVVIAIKPLGPGSTIGDDDVQLAETDITQPLGEYLTQLDEAVGMSVKRSIAQGRPLVQQQLAPPLMVRRGDTVMINAATSVISVKMSGVALTDGRRGEQIRIKNQGSARVIDARVTGPGQVQAQM
jgi:flagella basal body P-ring formation protein FlgA